MPLTPPFNLQTWIDENRHLLKPPVGNKCIVDGDFIIMIVGGPNSRSDYHWDEGPEFFYQLEGEMVLRVQDEGQRRDLPIRAGEIFYLPPRRPHSPQRMRDSIGLVIERRRLPHEKDGLLWFCEKCNQKLYEEYFVLDSIEKDFPPVFERYYGSLDARTCTNCGHVDEPPAKNSAGKPGATVGAPVKYSDIEDAVEYVSFGGMGNEAYLCRDTGVIHYHTDYGDNEEELPDDVDSDRYIAIPHKNDLDLGTRLVFRFAADVLPEKMADIEAIFRHRGAYARFKDMLDRCDKLQQWYDYEANAQRQALQQWCEDNDIEIAD